MRIITPTEINSSVLTSSIPEPDTARGEVEWVAGTYQQGDRVIKSSTHKVYEVVADPSTTDDPEIGVTKAVKTWVIVGATNRYKMFDATIGYQSEADTQIEVGFNFGKVTSSLAGFNITGASDINISVDDPTDGNVYTNDISMADNSGIDGWYDYFFSPIVNITRFIVTDLPIYPSAKITVTIDGGTIGLGELIAGNTIDLGVTEYGTGWQGLDFSRKERDEFGVFSVEEGRTADLLDYDITLPKSRFGYVKNTLKSLTSMPTVWIGDETDINDGTAVFGYYRDAQINISSPSIIDMTIQVEGLI